MFSPIDVILALLDVRPSMSAGPAEAGPVLMYRDRQIR
jgi:hypothetical protein